MNSSRREFLYFDLQVWVTHQSRHRSIEQSAAADAEDTSEETVTPVKTREVHRSYSRSTVDKHFCPYCDFSCNHESWLVTHMRQHASGKTDHKCSFCAYTAPNPHRLKVGNGNVVEVKRSWLTVELQSKAIELDIKKS